VVARGAYGGGRVGGMGMGAMTTPAPTHACPVPGCSVRELPRHLLMCKPHWTRVSPELQATIYDLWQAMETFKNPLDNRPEFFALRRQYLAARDEAIGHAARAAEGRG
jgi:hypothetical protein